VLLLCRRLIREPTGLSQHGHSSTLSIPLKALVRITALARARACLLCCYPLAAAARPASGPCHLEPQRARFTWPTTRAHQRVLDRVLPTVVLDEPGQSDAWGQAVRFCQSVRLKRHIKAVVEMPPVAMPPLAMPPLAISASLRSRRARDATTLAMPPLATLPLAWPAPCVHSRCRSTRSTIAHSPLPLSRYCHAVASRATAAYAHYRHKL
jgi:hypothetical protein